MTSEQKNRLGWVVIGGLVIFAVLIGILLAWWRPPQMGADEEVFTTVDALYTAVTARNPHLVAQCEMRLDAYRNANKLPPSAAAYLSDVIARTKNGHWESAAQRLYDFMKVQRREGRQAHRSGKTPHRPDLTKRQQ